MVRIQTVLQTLSLDLTHSSIITVAGTNGKGSVVAYLEAIYQQQGITTLAYTSPHILNYNERIRVNRQMVNDTELVAAFERIELARGDTSLTYFEFGTLAALVVLAEQQPSVAILEVGLGGRLDAVNCIDADVAVITSIGIDHTDWLGSDRVNIAREKAGIMRAGRPLVCGEPEPPALIAELAENQAVRLYQYQKHFRFRQTSAGGCFECDWDALLSVDGLQEMAVHQCNNAVTALAVVSMPDTGLPKLARERLASGDWIVRPPARMQQLSADPDVYLDIAHNPQAAEALAAELRKSPGQASRTSAVLAMLADKDVIGVVNALDAVIDHWYLAPTEGPRGLSVTELQQLVAKGAQAPSTTLQSTLQAVKQAKIDAEPDERIIVLGTFANATALLGEI